MASGKTAVGRELARALGCRFCDSDAEIERRTGVDIPYIFEVEGEARFRARERDVIAELTALDNVVLATGGGSVLDESTRRRLASTGTVVYLRTTVAEQLRRARHARNRPLLDTEDRRGVLEKLAADRNALYEELADVVIETTGRRVGEVVAAVLKQLKREGRASSQE